MAVKKEKVAELVKTYGGSEKNTGSTEVQIALLTEQINALSTHLKAHKKDFHGKRGLMVLVGKRKGLLTYLERNDRTAYVALIESLKLRK